VNQQAVIKLGLVSWLMLAVAMLSGSIGWLMEDSTRGAKSVAAKSLAAIGIHSWRLAVRRLGDGVVSPRPIHQPAVDGYGGVDGVLVHGGGSLRVGEQCSGAA